MVEYLADYLLTLTGMFGLSTAINTVRYIGWRRTHSDGEGFITAGDMLYLRFLRSIGAAQTAERYERLCRVEAGYMLYRPALYRLVVGTLVVGWSENYLTGEWGLLSYGWMLLSTILFVVSWIIDDWFYHHPLYSHPDG